MATDGLYVLPLESEESDGKPAKKRKHSDFLRNLAADSRGIPGIALSIWRRALRERPEAESEGAADDSDEQFSARNRKERTYCWIVPLDQLSLPAMPVSSAGDRHARAGFESGSGTLGASGYYWV
jgi:hypothetical protein